MSKEKLIDIEQLIASKNKKILKWIPKFLLRYLKRILHQDEINAFIAEHKDKYGIEWCSEVVKYIDMTYSIKGLEKIPKEGKIVMAMNHPLGGMDAIILVDALKNQRTDLKFIVNDILMNLESMNGMFVGINKHGKTNGSVRQQINSLFESDQAVCIFPAGLVSRKQKNEIQDLTWKKTFVTYSKQFDRTIIPIYIDGGLSNFFYRLAKIRKFFGIRMNIEMLYLSNELYKQKGKHVHFVVGDPVSPEELKESTNDRILAQEIKSKTYDLRNQL